MLSDSYFQRGRLYALMRYSYAQAISDFSSAIERAPDTAVYYDYRGYAYSVMGQNQEAQKDYQQARYLGYIPRQVDYPWDQSVKAGALAGVDLYSVYGEKMNDQSLSSELKYLLLTVENGNPAPFKKIWTSYDQSNNTVYVGFFLEGSNFETYAHGDWSLEEVFVTTVNSLRLYHPGASVYGWVQLEETIDDPLHPPLYGVAASYRQAGNNSWLMEFVIKYFGNNKAGYMGIYPEGVG